MDFRLTDGQREEIADDFKVDYLEISEVEAGLNETGLVKDAEDYYELCYAVISQYESMKFICKNSEEEARKTYQSLSFIIVTELKNKYGYFENDNLATQLKFSEIWYREKELHKAFINRHN